MTGLSRGPSIKHKFACFASTSKQRRHRSLPLIRKHDQVQRLVREGCWPVNSKLTRQESQVQLAEIQLRRAEELLKLYTDIETNEPKLNPDYQAPPAETATDAKTE